MINHITILTVSLFLFALGLLSSCNPFIDDTLNEVYPDTTVNINSLQPQICEVVLKQTDSTFMLTEYWTDKITGRIVYKMSSKNYLNNKLHGTKYAFNDAGDTLLIEHYDNGIQVDSSIIRYSNGNPKHIIYYSEKKDGVITFEIQYHENGMEKTDLIAYEDGKINGVVHYYDDSPQHKITESYFYREGVIIGIKIFNEKYAELDRKTAAMYKAYREDSIRIAEQLLAEGSMEEDAYDVPVFYIGTEKDGMFEVGNPDNWDIMKVDPVFMLKYYNR